jgi:hypothetical protein
MFDYFKRKGNRPVATASAGADSPVVGVEPLKVGSESAVNSSGARTPTAFHTAATVSVITDPADNAAVLVTRFFRVEL